MVNVRNPPNHELRDVRLRRSAPWTLRSEPQSDKRLHITGTYSGDRCLVESSGQGHAGATVKTLSQRELIRELARIHRGDLQAICAAYADAERAGRVKRSQNLYGVTPETYAASLWMEGRRRGWLT